MVEVPTPLGHHERAKRYRLVTDSGTVTAHEAMDRSRNRAVLAAIRERVGRVGESEWLDDVRSSGSSYDWGKLDDRLREAGASRRCREDIATLAERVERPYPSLLRLRVDPHTDVDFAPGQYVTLRAHGTPRAYSIASTPADDELEFAIRRVPGGRLTSDLFESVEVGDEVVVRGPNGHMVLADPTTNDVVFLATGTGVAPFKSMIETMFEREWDVYGGQQRQIWLFLGCGWADDVPYRERFRELADERENFHFVPTLTREPLISEWVGETDYVQQVFVKYLADDAVAAGDLPAHLAPYRTQTPADDVGARIDPTRTELYACGVSAMVAPLVRCARSVGVDDRRLQYEGFG